MKERPILFSAPMVRAILAGTKTQTRRVVKCDIRGPSEPMDTWDWYDKKGKWAGAHGRGFPFKKTNAALLCPYGQPGDRLFVRETWAYGNHALFSARDEDGPFVYAADGTTQGRLCDRWRPSIHMPRCASRITLEVTGVRVEKLRDISEADAIAEGAPWAACGAPQIGSHKVGFAQILESINGAGSWDANPWVWVIEFKRVEGSAA